MSLASRLRELEREYTLDQAGQEKYIFNRVPNIYMTKSEPVQYSVVLHYTKQLLRVTKNGNARYCYKIFATNNVNGTISNITWFTFQFLYTNNCKLKWNTKHCCIVGYDGTENHIKECLEPLFLEHKYKISLKQLYL